MSSQDDVVQQEMEEGFREIERMRQEKEERQYRRALEEYEEYMFGEQMEEGRTSSYPKPKKRPQTANVPTLSSRQRKELEMNPPWITINHPLLGFIKVETLLLVDHGYLNDRTLEYRRLAIEQGRFEEAE